jgi:hypothetical protein
MTDESSDTTTGDAGEPTANSNFAVLAAIADLGLNATPAAIATEVGIAYSTVNPKLRAWEAAGLAERVRHDNGQTLWRLTDAGRVSTATAPPFADTAAPAEPAAARTTAEPATTQSAAPPATVTPPSTATDTNDGDGDRPMTPVSAAVPADSDASLSEPAPRETPIGDDVEHSSDEKPDISADPAVSDTALSPDPGTVADPAPIATAEAAKPAEGRGTDAGTPTRAAAPVKQDRPRGAIPVTVLEILRANPDSEYKVEEMRKLIDQADEGKGFKRVSHGAVANAFTKLAGQGQAELVEGRTHATYRLTPAAD